MKKLLVTAVLLLITATACGDDKPAAVVANDGTPAGALAAARTQWAAKGLGSYSMSVEVLCFCPNRPTLQSEVVKGKVQPTTVTAPTWLNQPLSVPGLFDFIDDAIESGAAEVNVTYDAANGAPRTIFVDRSRELADEELSLNVTMTAK